MRKAAELVVALNRLVQEAESLQRAVGRNVFDRVAAAAELLADQEWLNSKHRGRVDTAREELERKFFPEIRIAVSLHKLLLSFSEFPDVREWEDRGFALERIVKDATRQRNQREAKPKEPQRPTKREVNELRQTVNRIETERVMAYEIAAEAQEQAQSARKQYESAEHRALRLKRELDETKAKLLAAQQENADLKAIIDDLHRQLRAKSQKRETVKA